MLRLACHSFDLPFEYPFTTAHGTKSSQTTLLISLNNAVVTGYGEAPVIAYYSETIDTMTASLEAKRNVLERYALIDPQRFWHFLHHLIPGQPFLTAALDIAGWDLYAKMRRKPLWQLLGLKWENTPVTDYTIGLDNAEAMVLKIKAHPWPVYKVKLARPDDIDLIRALRRETNVPFRVDANEGWNLEDTKRILPELKDLGVQLLEQPLPRDQWEAMKELKQFSPISLFADEACQVEQDVARCADGFHGINIKMSKCGGITPALRMITAARKLDIGIMMGSMNECSVGAAAVGHLLPLLDYADMDGPLLLSRDLAEGLIIKDGRVTLPEKPGLGIDVFPAVQKQLA